MPRADGTALIFRDGTAWRPDGPTRVMGILNVTPDSFSDGGRFYPSVAPGRGERVFAAASEAATEAAVDAALEMSHEGADIVDVGGESTRPGADPVPIDEELRRVLPVIAALRERSDVRISIDTRKAAVAARALEAGADLVNDVGGLRDPEMVRVVADAGCPVVIMHMRGEPSTMQRDTTYDDIVQDVRRELLQRAENAVAHGIADDKIAIDPGLGFGKSAEGNLALLRSLPELTAGPWPVLIGASRKSFLGKISEWGAFAGRPDRPGRPTQPECDPTHDRLEAGLAVAAWSAAHGARILRTHDVAQTVRVVRTVDAITRLEGRTVQPAHEGPAHEGPAHEGPAHEGPAHEGPAHEGPAREESAREESARDEPAHGTTAGPTP